MKILYYILLPFIKFKAWERKMEIENARMEEELQEKMAELALLRYNNMKAEARLRGR